MAARRWNDGGQGASPQGSVSILLVVLYANHVVVQNPSTQQQSLVRTTNARTFVVWSHFLSVKGRGRPAGQGERLVKKLLMARMPIGKRSVNRYNGVNSSLKQGRGVTYWIARDCAIFDRSTQTSWGGGVLASSPLPIIFPSPTVPHNTLPTINSFDACEAIATYSSQTCSKRYLSWLPVFGTQTWKLTVHRRGWNLNQNGRTLKKQTTKGEKKREKKEVDDDYDFTDVDRLLKMTLIHSTEADHLDEDDNVFYGNGPLVEDAASYWSRSHV